MIKPMPSQPSTLLNSEESKNEKNFTEIFHLIFLKNAVENLGFFTLFNIKALILAWQPPWRMALFWKHLDFIATQSVFIILLTSIFTGIVFAIQIYTGFHVFHAEGYVGPTVAIAITRELAPVLTGLVITGRAGAAITAEIASMRVSEQIDALETMGISSIQFLVSPRLWAGMIALPALTILFDFIGNLAAYYISTHSLGLDGAQYIARINKVVDSPDIAHGVIKAFVFGLVMSSICCYKGFFVKGGAEGVGKNTNQAVVMSMVCILFADFLLTGILPSAVEEFNPGL